MIALRRRVALVADIAVVGCGVIDAAVALVIRQVDAAVGVARVSSLLFRLPVQEGARIDHAQHAHTTVDGEGGLVPVVLQPVVAELLDLQIAHVRLIVEHAVGLQALVHVHEVHRPVVVELVGQPDAAAGVVGVVIVLLDEGVVVDDRPRRRVVGAARAVRDALAGLDRANDQKRVAFRQLAGFADVAVEGHLEGAGDVADVAALIVREDREAGRELVLDDRDVHEGAGRRARIRAATAGVAGVEARMEVFQVRLVGDVADGAAHGAGAEEGALRSGQHFDPLQVDGVDVEVAARDRARRVIEVQRDVRLRTGGAEDLQAGGVGGQAADVDGRGARSVGRSAHVRQEFNQLLEVGDAQLAERFTAQRLDGQRDLVRRFLAAGRRNDQVLNCGDRVRLGRVCGEGSARASPEDRHGERRCRQCPYISHSVPSPY